MKKILVVTEVFYPETFLINDLVLQWQRDGYKVDVLTQYPSYPVGKIFSGYTNEFYSVEKWRESTIHRFKLIEGYRESKIKKILNYWIFVRIGSRIAKKIGKDYDHIFVHQTGPLTVALPAIALKKKYGTPLTIWSFDIWPDAVYAYGFPRNFILDTFLKCIINKVYANSDHILVSSKRFREVIHSYVPQKEIEYVPNWLIGSVSVKSKLRLDSENINFTFTGNISVSQNLKNVILGFAMSKIENAVLNIIGDGSSFNSIKELIQKEHISNVFLHGRFPYDEMNDILTQSDILVLPLIADEGIEKTEPLKLQSYLTAQKAILGIVRGSARDIIEEEGLGVCADPTNIADIASKFVQSVEYAQKNAAQIKLSAQRLLDTRFNRKQIIEKINSIIA